MRNTLNLITQSHHLIYVMQPENRALIELDLFLKFAEQELAANQITFLLNKMGNSTRHKGILRSLKNRIADQALFIVPRDYALFDRAQARYATLAEVGARTSARRAIADLSIYLSKSM
jgi:cellulose biosynthesis protein BcsQ